MIDNGSAFRAIPPINSLIASERLPLLIREQERESLTVLAQKATEAFRRNLLASSSFCKDHAINSTDEILDHLVSWMLKELENQDLQGLQQVINATGIVLHTNLGRAPLPAEALEAISSISGGYCNLEYDLASGSRGSRYDHVDGLLQKLTGAESAMMVNNNAAAVFLCLNTLSKDREVIISRGQQVEIGGSFRIPDIINGSGAKMVEVGTTNKTRLSDYENALTKNSELILKVHTSNYKVTGFTEDVQLSELVNLSKVKGLMVLEDLGSGSLLDLTKFGLPHEPTVQESIAQGVDLVTFSGDKLLGGLQAGVIAGRRDLIEKIKKNPLTRMVRCDKTAIAALSAVLKIYLKGGAINKSIPALKMLTLSEEELTNRAADLESILQEPLKDYFSVKIIDDVDEAGGGSLPGVLLKGKAVALKPLTMKINDCQDKLRQAKTPIICRITQDQILINVRTIEPMDYKLILKTLMDICGVKLEQISNEGEAL